MAKNKAKGTEPMDADPRRPRLRRPKLKNKVYLAELDQAPARAVEAPGVGQGPRPQGRGRSSRAATPPARAARSRRSRWASTPASPASSPSPPPPSASARSGTSSATCAPARGRRDRPAGPQLVQPRRRRARDGLRDARGGRGVLPLLPGVRADARPLRDHPDQVLVQRQRRGAGAPVPGPHRRPRPSAGSSRRWTSSPGRAGSSTRSPRTRCSGTRTSSRRRGTWSSGDDKKRARLNVISHLLSLIPYEDLTPEPIVAAAARAGPRLRPPADGRADVHPGAVLTPSGERRQAVGRRAIRAPVRVQAEPPLQVRVQELLPHAPDRLGVGRPDREARRLRGRNPAQPVVLPGLARPRRPGARARRRSPRRPPRPTPRRRTARPGPGRRTPRSRPGPARSPRGPRASPPPG